MHACIGEGNGNPLQYSCLENPRERGACQAAIYEVAQTWTWLKWLSSSSSHFICVIKFVGIELFSIFLYYLFNVQGICSDVPSFISDISNLCPFSFFFLKLFLFIYLALLGLSCSMWDLVSQPGIEPGPPVWECEVLVTGPPGKSLSFS